MNDSDLAASFTPKIPQQKCHGRETCGRTLSTDTMRVIRDKTSGEDRELCPECFAYYRRKLSTVSRSSSELFFLDAYRKVHISCCCCYEDQASSSSVTPIVQPRLPNHARIQKHVAAAQRGGM